MENLDIYAYELAENKAREECADLIDGITNGFSPSDNENFDIDFMPPRTTRITRIDATSAVA